MPAFPLLVLTKPFNWFFLSCRNPCTHRSNHTYESNWCHCPT